MTADYLTVYLVEAASSVSVYIANRRWTEGEHDIEVKG